MEPHTPAAGPFGTPDPEPNAVVEPAYLVRVAARMAGLGGWQLDLATDIVTWSPEVAATHGMPHTRSLLRAQALAVYTPPSRALFIECLRACIDEGEEFDREFELTTPGGAPVWTRAIGQPVHGQAGSVLRVQGACQNITEYATARKEAQRLSSQLWTTLESITDAFMMLDLQGGITYVNRQFERVVGRPRESLIGQPVWSALKEGRGTKLETELRRMMATGEQIDFEERFPGPVEKWLAVRQFPSPEGYAIYVRDITAQKQEEAERAQREQLAIQAQKLESLGALAGGVAHEFNNMLGAILGNTGMALEALPAAQEAVRENLNQVQYASLRAREMVQRILAFSRTETDGAQTGPSSLRRTTEESIKLLRAMLPMTVDLRVHLPTHACTSCVDPTSVQQVLINLCTNAWHALPQGKGRVDVGLECWEGHRPMPGLPSALEPGRYARLWVDDEGVGMDAQTRDRIFDPFFTTKPRGTGTGLGLSIVHGIVKASRGEIVVESEPGQGTRFSVFLPLAEPGDEPAARAEDGTAEMQDGQGRLVMLIDDDPIVLMTSQRILERRGFRVLAFDAADKALERLQDRALPVAVLVTDFSMPGLSGLDVAREARRLHPRLPVVLSSGYVADDVKAVASKVGVRAIMHKANLFDDLVNVVLAAVS